MKILYSHYLADDTHPAAQMVRRIAEELRGLGHAVEIHRSLGPAPAGPKAEESREVGSRSRRGASVRGAAWFLKAILRNAGMSRRDLEALDRVRPDVVLARQDAYCVSMAEAAARRGVPLVIYADAPVAHEVRRFNPDGRWHPPGLVEAIERRGLGRSRAILTISRPSARILGGYGLEVPIEVAPNGVRPEHFPEIEPAERARRRAALGIGPGRVLGFQGSFKAFHGIERLRDLMLATADRPDLHWLLIGDGPDLPALREAVAGRVRASILGRRPPEEVGALLGLVDIAIAPHPIDDGPFYFCPLKILEYAAAGCAVVAGDQGDIASLLDDGRAGVLVRESELSLWEEAIDRLLADDPARIALGHAARRFVMDRFTWRQAAEKVERVLSGAIGDDPGVVQALGLPSRRRERPMTSKAGVRSP